MASSPYVIGQWVRGEKFYGRTALLEEILEGNRNWIWLLGTRRIGKTSVLKQLEWLTASGSRKDYFPLFWDFQGAEDSGELHRGFGEALFDAEERFQDLGVSLSDVEGSDLFDSLTRVRRKLRPSGRRLLLLCDEVEELIKLHKKDPALLRKLRRAMQSQEDIRTVMASTIRLWELARQEGDTSPFLHGFAPPLYIHRLTDEEAVALVRQANLASDSQPKIEGATAEAIRSRCDNHPYLIQLVGKRFLESGDLDDAINEVATDGMVSHFFSVDFEMLSPQEHDILRVVAESTAANSNSIQEHLSLDSDSLGTSLQRLEKLGYLRRNVERRYELANFFFRRWFVQQGNRRPGGTVSPSEASTATEETKVEPAKPGLFDGRYRLVEQIGKGATGIVYRADDEVVRETIAIKILKPEYCDHPEALERVRQEILLARDIGHPNILRIYHLGECRGQWYMTMKWISGSTLAEFIRRGHGVAVSQIVALSSKLASALEAAHEKKVLHRDIKPQNILLDERNEPYLTDFGLARLLGTPGLTKHGVFLGTPDYASPEQASLKPLDERSDLYALGIVMFEMSTGVKPFKGETVEHVLELHRTAAPPDPQSLRRDLPHALSRVILRCLEKQPARRYPSARALRIVLEEMRGAR